MLLMLNMTNSQYWGAQAALAIILVIWFLVAAIRAYCKCNKIKNPVLKIAWILLLTLVGVATVTSPDFNHPITVARAYK